MLAPDGSFYLRPAAPDAPAVSDDAVARAFVTRLCALPDLDPDRAHLDVPLAPDTVASLLARVPTMPGAEHASDDRLKDASWQRVEAGPWLREMLAGLRDPARLAGAPEPAAAARPGRASVAV